MNPTTPTTPTTPNPTSDWREETAALRATIKTAVEESIKRSEEADKRAEANHQRAMARIAEETARIKTETARIEAETKNLEVAHGVYRKKNENFHRNVSRGVEDAFAVSLPDIMENQYGVRLDETLRRIRNENRSREIDILGLNGSVAVVGEAKVRVKQVDIDALEARVLNFRKEFPQHSRPTIYGVIAGMAVDEDAEIVARKRGFLVLCMNGGVLSPTTPPDFRPLAY